MLLKRLELQGFKSFVDKTVLDFGSGVTGVVGPNGSGKSNIADAIKWVMGETSAKSLRGGNMQDVIFAGTTHRKPVNYAEVSLVLDNSEHTFNVDFEEVVVTRRVFRSGETAYLINRAPCRLRDIHELFMDTGLGRDGYSMIGQGSVAQIISTKAEDRRSIFEEAAGVSKYKYKRDEATRKLTQTEDNLVRINDVTAELESRIEPLKHQSEKARKYLVFYDEFKGLDVTMTVKNIDRNAVLKEEADKLYADVNEELTTLRSEDEEIEKRISSLYENSSDADAELKAKNDAFLENNNQVNSINGEISVFENTIKNNETDRIRTEAEIESEEKKIEEKTAEIESNNNLKVETNQKIEELDQTFSGQKDIQTEIAERIQSIGENLNVKRQELLAHRNEVVAGKMRIKGIDDVATELTERRASLETEKEQRTRNTEETKAEIERLSEELATKKEKNIKIQALVDKAKADVEEQTELAQTMLGEFNTAKLELGSAQSKYKMLYDMEQEYDGYSRSVKTILKTDELKGYAIYGTVAGLIDVKKEYAVAVETALGAAMQNIIVEDEDDAKACIEYLRRTNGGRATFLPISSVKSRGFDEANKVSKETGFVGVASGLVNINSAYREIISNLLGRVVVVDNIDNGIAISKKFGYKFKIVTLLGDVLNAGGSMSGGSANKTSGFLSRAAELKELKSQIAHMEKALATKQGELARVNEALKSAKERVATYSPTAHEYETEIIRIENTLTHLNQSVEASSGDDSIQAELDELNERISKNSDETIEALSIIRTAEAAASRVDEEIKALNEELTKAEADRESAGDDLVNYTLNLQELRRDITEAENRITSLTNEIEAAKILIETKNRAIKESEANSLLLTDKIKNLNASIDALNASNEQINAKKIEIENEKERITNELQLIQSSNKDLTDKLLNLQQELTRAENKQAKLETDRDNLLNHLWDEYELTYSDAAASYMEEIEDEKIAAKRLQELKGKIRSLGSVNMESIEEYKQVSERYEFLSTQRDDLEKSKDNLNKIISSMEDMMQTHFSEQFTKIGESFSEVFKELFGGGVGKLYLSEPDDILNSGIEIEVQLPGKGMQNISLYSGGEKSFIAIAILFAILRVKPTPFCMLDEIDAALDDVNVSRFATYLHNYLDKSQFIVITHRRGTMEAANIIYGVTMQEKGVSKLLSLHIDDIQEEIK